MGTMPVPKLIITISLPMVFSMFVQALYNIVDSIFVAKINEAALTAVSLAFPIQTLMIAVGIGTSVGVNALLSTRLGQKRQDDVDSAAMNGLFLALCSFLAFFILGFFILEPYLQTQVQHEEIIQFGMDYLTIVVFGSFGMFMVLMLDRILQGTGLTFYTMISQVAGAVTNIVFDPLLIFGFGPFPRMGMAGAALATVMGQYVSMVLSLIFNLTKNKEVHFRFRGFRPNRRTIIDIYRVGVPAILLNAISSVTTYLMDIVLGFFSTTAIAVYGVYFKINSFIFMPVFGLNNGLVPIIAYNYGAEKKRRIIQTIRTGLLYALGLMVLGTVIFELFPTQLLGLFSASDDMLAIGIPALRIIATSFVGAAIAITLNSVFQAFSDAVYSMIVSFMRQFVVLLPSAYILSLSGNVNNVWWCFPIAEIVSLVASVLFLIRILRTKVRPMRDEA
ncbi:MAG: MATE family efflux transporter [Treponema sp.]|nr:MATE family efflux transporter [Treponema sp.]